MRICRKKIFLTMMISDSENTKKLSKNGSIKENSSYLRGTILEGLSDTSTGSISPDDAQLTKFHGTYLGEIGLVGKAPGKYNPYLDAGLDGTRLNKLHKPEVTHDEIVSELKPVLQDFSENRNQDGRFGDFCIRRNYVKATGQGADFHD